MTPGTSVAANKKLQALSIEPAIQYEGQSFRPMGSKFQTIQVPNREWVQAGLSGVPTYTEIVYPLSSVLDVATITTPAGGTDSRLWTFEPSSTSADAPKTFTVEQGDAVRAHKFTHGLVTEFGINWSRGGIELTGSMLGRRLEDAITMTAAPTSVELVPVVPTQVSVYLDDTDAGLGTTKLTRALSASLSIGNRYNPLWVLDAAEDSFVTTVETEPSATLTIMAEADATGMGTLLPLLRSGDTRFIRVEAVGAEIETGENYTLTVDLAGQVAGVSDFSDQDGVYAVEWTFNIAHDATWGKALSVAVENDLTAL